MTTSEKCDKETAAPLLSLQSLSVSFRTGGLLVPAVENVSFDIHKGQTVAIVGESGSGKSTTAAAINRLLPENGQITSGKVLFEGVDLVQVTESQMLKVRGAGIGLVPQDPMSGLNPLMRVGAQIAEALEVQGRARGKEAWRKSIDLLNMVGITDAAKRVNQYPHEFSGGMRQRVLIAIGLACEPRLLIADEPTSALDVTVQRHILDELDELTTRMGTAVILITHDLALAAERADRIAVMCKGEIVESGAADAILHNPQHQYTKDLLQAAPSLTTRQMVTNIRSTSEQVPAIAPLIEVVEVTKVFNIRRGGLGTASKLTAVDNVSFSIPPGETVSIVGESGSGKSTIANIILGLEDATSGQILLEGADVTGFNRQEMLALHRRVQPVFQNPYASLDPRYTVALSISEPLRVNKIGDAGTRRERVAELLDQVAIPKSMASRFPHELSGGQRQRVAIARALALSPDLVVLDEPVSALDVIVQAQVLELLASLQRELNLSYLFISHDLAVVRMISHAVHVMQKGSIVESGTPDAIFENPQSPYTQELLAAIPGAQIAA